MAEHFMIDLETMSTASDAAILSIGVQPFDPRGDGIDEGAGLLINVDLQACMTAGLRVDASTIMWWLAQSDDARAALYGKMSDAVLLSTALQELVAFGQRSGGWSWAKIWSNGAAFDIPILEHAFRVCRRDIPWEYNNVLDVRTMKWLAPDVPRVTPTVIHNALSDAQAQAVYVQRCYAAIKGPGVLAAERVLDAGSGQTIGEALEIAHNRTVAEPPTVFFVLGGLVNGEEGCHAVPAGVLSGADLSTVMADGWYVLMDDDPDGVGPFLSREAALRNA